MSKLREKCSPAQWECVVSAPWLVFLLVAGVDGKIDDKEKGLFGSLLNSAEVVENPYFKEIIVDLSQRADQVLDALAAIKKSPLEGIVELNDVLDETLPAQDARALKVVFYNLGNIIAKASGGFLGLGPKVSKEEKAALDFLVRAFKLKA